MPPLPRICVHLCKYMYERVEKLDFSQLKVWKRAFYPAKSHFAEIIKFVGNIEIHKGGPLRSGSEASSTSEKL